MAKIASPEEFSDCLIKDFNWRLFELSDLKLVADCGDLAKARSRRRSLVVMCYAHWEGHAKYCAEKFVEYITVRRYKFSEFVSHFYQVRFVNEIAKGGSISLSARMELVKKILDSHDDRLSKLPDGLINTRSNLNSEVLQEICIVCGIEFDKFVEEGDFLDRFLLKRRNEVAHGEAAFVDSIDADDLVDRTTKLMRLFRDSLDNVISTAAFKQP